MVLWETENTKKTIKATFLKWPCFPDFTYFNVGSFADLIKTSFLILIPTLRGSYTSCSTRLLLKGRCSGSAFN